MNAMEYGRNLHGQVCRGEKLLPEERIELDAWYAAMDTSEAMSFQRDVPDDTTNEELRVQIRQRLLELQDAVEVVRRIEEKNVVLQRQNEELKRQLVAKGILAA